MKSENFVLFVILFVLIIGAVCLIEFSNETTMEHTVFKIDKVEKTTGSSDGFTTVVYYLVSTSEGAYQIKTSGINAAPQCARIQKDSTYTMTTRGLRIPLLGFYPKIIDVE